MICINVSHFSRSASMLIRINDIDDEISIIETACVSNIINEFIELNHLQNHFLESRTSEEEEDDSRSVFSMTFVESVSLNERSTHLHIARMTFSTLFSRDVVSFNNSRMRIIFLADYNTHVMRYRDDRFVRHSQFRY
jgi:hypothetical protein